MSRARCRRRRHQSHSYTDGGCLYFTFAAKTEPDDRDRYYRAAWDAGTRAVLAAGGALSHHHGVGLNRSRFVAEALGPAFEVLVATKAALDPNGILNPGKLGLPSALRTARLLMSILVIDVGTSGLRAAVVRPDATIAVEQHRELLPGHAGAGAGRVRRDPHGRGRARRGPGGAGRGRPGRRGRHRQPAGVDDRVGPRDRRAGRARRWAGRTCGRSAPASCSRPTGSGWHPTRRPPRSPTCSTRPIPTAARDLCVGTVDTWLTWHLSEGALHVTDATNAGVTGLQRGDGSDWDDRMLDALRIDRASLPTVVDSSGVLGAGHRARRARRRSRRSWATSSRR